MQQAEMLRNEALGATLVKKLKLRGFDAYYCADKQTALKQASGIGADSAGGCCFLGRFCND